MDENVLRDIGQIQRSDIFQRYLRASSYLYSRAKLISGLQVLLTVIIPIILSTVSAFLSNESQHNAGFKGWAAFYGIFISLLDTAVFDKSQKDLKKDAAKVQELFDCDLLVMPWNEFKVGDKPAPEKIDQSAKALKRELTEKQKNWYPAIAGSLPLYLCRIVCQRSNIWWDGELRRKYAQYLSGIAWTLAVLAAAVGLIRGMSIDVFILSVMAPIFPTFMWLIKEVKKQKDSTNTLDRLMKHAAALWNNAIEAKVGPGEAARKSRELQDELFIHRYSNQPVPNWVNKLLGRNFDITMNIGAKELVAQAQSIMTNLTYPGG